MIRKLIAALVAMFLCGTVLAAGARLYNATDFVDKTREAATLNAGEASQLARLRSASDVFGAIKVTKINVASLGSGVLTLTLLDGTDIEYVGSTTQTIVEGMSINSWSGKSASNGYVTISYSSTGLSGHIHEKGKTYRLGTLPGARFFFVAEMLPRQLQMDTPSTPSDTLPQRSKGQAK